MLKYLLPIVLFSFFAQSASAQENEKKAKEFNYQDFGQGISVGPSLMGLGIIGVPIRISKNGLNQLEIVISYTPSVEVRNNISQVDFEDYTHGVSLELGYNFLIGSRHRSYKRKIVKHYISPKTGITTNSIQQVMGGVTWRREVFKQHQEQYSRGLDLGLAYLKGVGNDRWVTSGNSYNQQLVIFVRVDWNWYKK